MHREVQLAKTKFSTPRVLENVNGVSCYILIPETRSKQSCKLSRGHYSPDATLRSLV